MNRPVRVTRLTVVRGGMAVYTIPVNEYTSDLDTLRKQAVEAYLKEVSKELNVDLTYNEIGGSEDEAIYL